MLRYNKQGKQQTLMLRYNKQGKQQTRRRFKLRQPYLHTILARGRHKQTLMLRYNKQGKQQPLMLRYNKQGKRQTHLHTWLRQPHLRVGSGEVRSDTILWAETGLMLRYNKQSKQQTLMLRYNKQGKQQTRRRFKLRQTHCTSLALPWTATIQYFIPTLRCPNIRGTQNRLTSSGALMRARPKVQSAQPKQKSDLKNSNSTVSVTASPKQLLKLQQRLMHLHTCL
jgi:hypothetical protein